MGRSAQGVREYFSNRGGGANTIEYNRENVDYIKKSLMSYSKTDYRNNSARSFGFNDKAQWAVEMVANGNYGFATSVEQTAVNSPNWKKYGYQLSEKQSYVIADALVKHKIVNKRDGVLFNTDIGKEIKRDAEIRRKKREEKYADYSSTYKRSSTKVEVGAKVVDSKGRVATIDQIITKSSGYVSVKYSDGTTSKQMAFNLKGEDGNPLKKRPK